MLLPSAIEFAHAFEKHTNKICTAKHNFHLHQYKLGCAIFHTQIQVFSQDFPPLFKEFPQHLYASIFAEKSIKIEPSYYTKKTSRGPPNFIVS